MYSPRFKEGYKADSIKLFNEISLQKPQDPQIKHNN
jgi:hypothetical protein